MKNTITSIDIGSQNVRGVVGYVNTETGELNVIACHSVISRGVKEGEIVDMQSTANAIRKVVSTLEHRVGGKINSVYVAIPGKNLSFIEKSVPHIRPNAYQEITKKELLNYKESIANVNIPDNQVIIDIIPVSYGLDDKLFLNEMPYGQDCKELTGTYKIVTCEKRAYRHLERCLSKSDLTIAGTVLSTEATAWACLSEAERRAGAVVVDLGAGMTDISIFKDGMLVDMQVLEIGGNIITEDVVDGCKILPDNAERLKTRYGCAVVRAEQEGVHIGIDGFHQDEVREISIYNLAHIINARVDEIAWIIDELIGETDFRDDLIVGMILTGGSSQLNSIAEAFAERTGMSVRTKNSQQFNAKDDIVRSLNPSYSVALGTLIKVAETIPEEEKTLEFTKPSGTYNNENEATTVLKEPKITMVSNTVTTKKPELVKEEEPERVGFWERLSNIFFPPISNTEIVESDNEDYVEE